MRAERSALNRDSLPFIDLHQERSAQQRTVFAQNCRRLAVLGILALLCLGGLLPLTTTVRSYRPLLSVAERDLSMTQTRFAAVTQAQTSLQEPLKHWTRFEESRNARRQNALAFAALTGDIPREVCIEQVETETQDRQMTLKMQGFAETMDSLSAFVTALSHRPGFAGVRLTETIITNDGAKHIVRFHAEATVGKT